jgi:hypothetical protein
MHCGKKVDVTITQTHTHTHACWRIAQRESHRPVRLYMNHVARPHRASKGLCPFLPSLAVGYPPQKTKTDSETVSVRGSVQGSLSAKPCFSFLQEYSRVQLTCRDQKFRQQEAALCSKLLLLRCLQKRPNKATSFLLQKFLVPTSQLHATVGTAVINTHFKVPEMPLQVLAAGAVGAQNR